MSEIHNVSCNVWTKSFLRSSKAVHIHTYSDNYRIVYGHYHLINLKSPVTPCQVLFSGIMIGWLYIILHIKRLQNTNIDIKNWLGFYLIFLFCIFVYRHNVKFQITLLCYHWVSKKILFKKKKCYENDEIHKYITQLIEVAILYIKNQQFPNQNEAFQP